MAEDLRPGTGNGNGDVAGRLGEAAEVLEPLTATLAPDWYETAMDRTVELIANVVPDCAAVTITVLGGPQGPYTAASDQDWATELDQHQYRLGDGPCLHAARTYEVLRLDFGEAASRWPAFVAAGREYGVGSYISVGMRGTSSPVGSVNLYGRGPTAFDALDETLTRMMTRYAELSVAAGRQLGAAADLTDQLQHALRTRPVIDWAVGILMVQTPCGPERAFALLRSASQHQNVKLREVAARIVERTARRAGG